MYGGIEAGGTKFVCVAGVGPDDIRLMSIRKADQPSLIEIRQHFVPEMVKSLEEY